MAQHHSDLEVSPPVDVELDAPEGANLINLQDLSSIAGWADMAIDEARTYLSNPVEDSQDLGITSLLKSLMAVTVVLGILHPIIIGPFRYYLLYMLRLDLSRRLHLHH